MHRFPGISATFTKPTYVTANLRMICPIAPSGIDDLSEARDYLAARSRRQTTKLVTSYPTKSVGSTANIQWEFRNLAP